MTWSLKQVTPVLPVRLLLDCYLCSIPRSFYEFSSLHIVHGSYLTFSGVLIVILLGVRGVLTIHLANQENFNALVFQRILAVLFHYREGWLEGDAALFNIMIYVDVILKLLHHLF